MTVADPSPADPRRATRTDLLRRQLAEEIASGRLLPGTTLDEMGLAARYGVSRTPVREALRQLAAGGLVEIRPHRGAVVALPTEKRLAEMFVAMAELESVCAGLAAEAMSARERRDLERLHGELGELVRSGDPLLYAEANETFHNAIYAGAHNGYLAEMTLQTRVRLAPFRRAQFQALGRLALSYAEHDRVVDAILRGDRDVAAAAMRAHIEIVRVAFEEFAEAL